MFVLAVFALLTLEQLLAAERPRLAAVLTEGLWYAAALVGGLCLRMLVTTGIHLVLPPQAAANGATEILWAFYPFVYLAKLLVKSILINYALRGCFYLPIAELAVAVPVFVALVIALAVRKSGLCCCSPVRECCSHWCCCRLCREVLTLPHLPGVCAVCGAGGAGRV